MESKHITDLLVIEKVRKVGIIRLLQRKLLLEGVFIAMKAMKKL
jgi:hypothetical protein